MISKSLIRFSVNGQGCVPTLLFDLRPNYDGGNEDNVYLLQKVPCRHCCSSAPNPAAGHRWFTPPLETPGHSWASLGQSLVGSLLLSLGSWCTQSSVCALQESVSPVLWLGKVVVTLCGVNGDLHQEGLCHTQVCCTQRPCPCSRPLLTHISAGDKHSKAGLAQSLWDSGFLVMDRVSLRLSLWES